MIMMYVVCTNITMNNNFNDVFFSFSFICFARMLFILPIRSYTLLPFARDFGVSL